MYLFIVQYRWIHHQMVQYMHNAISDKYLPVNAQIDADFEI